MDESLREDGLGPERVGTEEEAKPEGLEMETELGSGGPNPSRAVEGEPWEEEELTGATSW